MTSTSSEIEIAAQHLAKAKRIVILTGAGISTAAGIPDFRSPTSGLYAKLAPLKLPFPEAIFHISYFTHTPEPFYAIAKARHPRCLKPTKSHAFLGLLARKGLLHFLFTQNTDGLEENAFVPADKVLAVHGNWKTQRCHKCNTPYPDELMKKAIAKREVPYCLEARCKGAVKPDVVFFGQSLPAAFDEKEKLIAEADLVIVMGTSLKVAPCSRLPRLAREGVPRILINMESAGDFGTRPEDVQILGSCDDGVKKLADMLGWSDELDSLCAAAAAAKEEPTDDEEEISLDECISRLVQKNQGKQVSDGHKRMLESHLQSKFAHLLRSSLPRTPIDSPGNINSLV
ncbi:conserved hypothetical protein [Aspergillus terreus NIH2624]|uniref:NAD-dependent protein deacetylase n=1 Tax=Aspergillus terreus (strain NIH 2624 / FGSC A1156) TaxID=341663 RepID=Q0C868_ASPTN|nr:uncharacterized protein ATEG_10116 [Aspergillus terreus NIH2624]EAU29565.1 conserved hypothetical protein [Aspergillus terreus NIH2624]